MRKVRKTLPIILPAFAILGILAVSGHARKPTPPPEPTVSVTGAITAYGDPKAIRVTFLDESLLTCKYEGDATQGPQFLSNPDNPPSLKIILSAPPGKHLRYYYCAHTHDTADFICNDASHSPYYYYCLTISGGITQKKNPSDTDHVVFPEGSPWSISWKNDNSTVAEGTLSMPVTYEVIK
jgi:hypothetical protein